MTLAPGFTVLVAAHNAESTIGRALASIVADAERVLLVDDGSTDSTVDVARRAAGSRLQIVRRPHPGPLGATRHVGLSHVTTRWAAWLDADDEFLPGRLRRVREALERSGAGVAVDATVVVDDVTGLSRRVPLPDTSSGWTPPARLFERNPLPAIGLVGFSVADWQRLEYDPALHGAEDVDIVLRAVAEGVRFEWLHIAGTRVHVRPDSLSRQRSNQRAMYARALAKHHYGRVRELYGEAGWNRAVTCCGLASMALFRNEPAAALQFVEEAEHTDADRWLCRFWRGTALLMKGQRQSAVRALEAAEQVAETAEAANNLGAALASDGLIDEARRWFEVAVARLPEFEDARANLTASGDWRVTTHPLRNRG